MIMLALVGNNAAQGHESSGDAAALHLDHQEDVVTRRTKYDLNKAEERAHILQGLLIALDNIDEVIKIIRGSANTQAAKAGFDGALRLSLMPRPRLSWICVCVR